MGRIFGIRQSLGLLFCGDLTRDWVAASESAPLTVDLSEGTLAGVPIWNIVDELSPLGCSDECRFGMTFSCNDTIFSKMRPEFHRDLVYKEKGISIGVAGPRLVDSFKFHFEEINGFKPFSGQLIREGVAVSLMPQMKKDQIRQVLGSPDAIDEESKAAPVWPAYKYFENGNVVTVQFNDDGKLSALSIREDDRFNPTGDWTRDTSLELVADFDSGSLGGVGVGSQFEHLRFLGPATDVCSLSMKCCDGSTGVCDKLLQTEHYEFGRIGVRVATDHKGVVESFGIKFGPLVETAGRPFRGRIMLGGVSKETADLRSTTQVYELLGPADATTEGVPSFNRFIEYWFVCGNALIELCCDSEGNIAEIGWSAKGEGWIPNPSKLWVGAQDLNLAADWDAPSICGVSLGDSFERLSMLGPANNYRRVSAKTDSEGDSQNTSSNVGVSELTFYRHSICAGHNSNGCLVYFNFAVSRDKNRVRQPWPGALYVDGSPVSSLEGYGEGDVTRIFGAPTLVRAKYRKNGALESKSFVYESDHAVREIHFDAAGIAVLVQFVARKSDPESSGK